jgi:urocanate reductase
MKRFLIMLSTALAVLFLYAGCSKKAYRNGTYTETVPGNNGDVTVAVAIATNKITGISIVKSSETPGLGDKAFEKLIPQIIKTQSVTVDAVSGATHSSNALKEAVAAALAAADTAGAGRTVTTFKPGTYTGTATGNNGPLTVTLTVSKDRMESLTVDSVESPGIGKTAIELLTRRVLDNQSLKIDTISGATVTTAAFREALAAAVDKSGITRSILESKPVACPAKTDTPVEKSADVIIVGAGGAGFAAAATILESGASVIMIEKNEYVGGNTARAGGTLNAPDPERQKPLGIDDSVERFFQNTMEAGDNKANHALVRILAANALDARHWLSAHGTQWTEKIYETIGGLWPRSMDEKDKIAYNGFIAPLLKVVDEKGGEIILNCRAYQLEKDASGRVTKVLARDTRNGQEYVFTAGKSVILTTGGYAANPAMVEKYDHITGIPTSNAPTSTGDGIDMGLGIGAALTGMEYIQVHPHGNPKTGNLESAFAGVIKNTIYVNKEGKRFTEESGRRDVISNDTMKQTGKTMYAIFDSEGGFYTGIKMIPDLKTQEEKGNIFEAATIGELAKNAGLDSENLVATVDRYNSLVRAGKDTDFNKDEVGLEIRTGPFYCVPLSPTLHHTMGGLEINTKAQVLDGTGKVIPGLYAAGEVTGGIHGSNRVGGNALTDCVVFGRIAGANSIR